MNILNELLYRELSGLLNPWSYFMLACGVALIYLVFSSLYMVERRDFFKLDNRVSDFESSFMQKFYQYLTWATVQQTIVIASVSFLPLPDALLFIAAAAIFCAVHTPNKRLMLFTGIFGMFFYYAYFIGGLMSVSMIAVLHAFAGSLYYKLGWDMRVLWVYHA